jgi:SAM-dependent methyltransferase
MQSAFDLQERFGGIDIYLFDQLLKRRFVAGMRVLDAGCGSGRNLVYFLRSGYEVFGVDKSEQSIAQTRELAAELAPHLPAENFRVEPVERMSFGKEGNIRQQTAGGQSADLADYTDYIERTGDQQTVVSGQRSELGRTENTSGFDVVISSAVLHFARDEQQWQAMVNEMWRVLNPGGIFFVRLASTIGIEDLVRLVEGRRYHLPDGSDRFLVDAAMLQRVTAALGGEFLEPIKTTIVENMRAMTTWVVRKK